MHRAAAVSPPHINHPPSKASRALSLHHSRVGGSPNSGSLDPCVLVRGYDRRSLTSVGVGRVTPNCMAGRRSWHPPGGHSSSLRAFKVPPRLSHPIVRTRTGDLQKVPVEVPRQVGCSNVRARSSLEDNPPPPTVRGRPEDGVFLNTSQNPVPTAGGGVPTACRVDVRIILMTESHVISRSSAPRCAAPEVEPLDKR